MKRFKNMLFVTDPELKCADTFARAVAMAEHNQAQLTVISILEDLPAEYSRNIINVSMAELRRSIIDNLSLQLEKLVAPARKNIQVKTGVLMGQPFLELIREVLREKVDLVIKTAEQGGIADRFFGSADLHLLRKCPCPVLLMKSTKRGRFHKILTAVDFEPFENKPAEDALNRQILKMSTSLALSELCELHIIHVWYPYGEGSLRAGFAQESESKVDAYVDEVRTEHKKLLEKLLTEFDNKAGVEAVDYLKPKVHLIKGIAKNVIPEVVKEFQIDLVMMGTVGRTGIPGFIMGNTAETILNQIDCSVFAIKPEGFITPVTL